MSNLFRNSTYLLLAQLAAKGISFFYTIFLAKHLGVENFGLYSLALSYFAIISVVADFGIGRYLTREVAKDNKTAAVLIGDSLFLRIVSSFSIFVFLAVAISFLDPNHLRTSLIILALLAVVPQSIALVFDAVIIAFQKASLSAFGIIFLGLFNATFGFLMVNLNGVYGAVTSLVASQLTYALFLLFIVWRQGVNFNLVASWQISKRIFLNCWQYGLLGMIGLISYRSDILILSYFRGNYETGIYSAAYRLIDALILIPNSLGVMLFPLASQLVISDQTRLRRVYFKSISCMFILGLFVAIGATVVLPVFFEMFLTKYLPSIAVFKILVLSLPFTFMHIPAGQIVLSSQKHLKQLIFAYTILFIINISLAINIIPVFGFTGAAWVSVIAEISTLVMFLILIQWKILQR